MPKTMKNFVVNGDERSIQDTLSKLKFISMLKQGEKIDVENMSVQEDSILLSIIRTFFRNDSRKRTISFIRTTYGEAFEVIEDYMSDEKQNKFNKKIAQLVLTSIRDSQGGLNNLISTYSDDRMFVATVQTILDTIGAKLQEFSRGGGSEK